MFYHKLLNTSYIRNPQNESHNNVGYTWIQKRDL
jgi:hypothetical protein